ncbi:MAG: hypothetical protein GQ549_04560 [Gammaproteobacteria bacterium]|nr:hypothetical protein [Gammaproteobacteria bacterium]
MEAVTANSEATVKLLLANGANSDLKNEDDKTAMDIAIKAGNRKMKIQALLKK